MGISTSRYIADLTNTFTQNDGSAQGSTAILWGPILTDFLNRLMDCLFDRIGNSATAVQKAEQAKSQIASFRHPRGRADGPWGGWRAARVRQTALRLRQSGAANGTYLTQQEWNHRAIQFLNDAESKSTEELAAVIAELDSEEAAIVTEAEPVF